MSITLCCHVINSFFFFKQKTAYEMRISDWSSDVCSSDLPLNNARLLPFGLYDQWVPAFAALFQQKGGDWLAFYAAVEKLGSLPIDERKAALKALAGSKTSGD